MKHHKLILHTLLVFLLLLIPGSLLFPARAGHEPSGSLNLLSLEIHVDEATDRVDTTLILENPLAYDKEEWLDLPLISTGMKDGSLVWSSLLPGQLMSGNRVLCTIPAGKVQLIHFSYESATPLNQARVIGLDPATMLQPHTDVSGPVKRLRFSLTFLEEDIPLVKELSPINWELKENTLSWQLYDFWPGDIRLYVEKETYRNLKGNREYAPNKVQQKVLDEYRTWFTEGLDIPRNNPDIYSIFNKMLGKTGSQYSTNHPNWWKDYNENLPLHTGAYQSIVDYLILRELIRGNVPEKNSIHISPYYLWPLTAERMRQYLYGDELYRVMVCYGMEESLQDTPIYSLRNTASSSSYGFGNTDLVETPPRTLMTILPASSTPWRMESLMFRLDYSYYDQLDITELTAMQADLLVHQQILDEREESLPKHSSLYYENEEFHYTAYLQLIPDNPLTREIWDRAMEENEEGEYYTPYLFSQEERPLYSWPTDCPTLYQYSGSVQQEKWDDRDFAVFHNFDQFGYYSRVFGLLHYRNLLQDADLSAWRADKAAAWSELARDADSKAAAWALQYVFQTILRRIYP